MSWYELENLNKINNDLTINKDIIWLDFGHGGSETGCVFYDGSYEKDYNLKFGQAVYNLVSPFFKKVYITRKTDNTVTLSTRCKNMTTLADKSTSLQVFSFHCNAYNKISRGAEVCLSISTNNTMSENDTIWTKQFLKDYCNTFNLTNRGIVRRKNSAGSDYYALMRLTPSNCKSKIIELFFGDNRDDFKIGTSEAYFDKAVFFVASYILKRYGVVIEKPDTSGTLYLVQTGAFSKLENAEAQVKALNKKGFDAIIKST